VHRKYHHAELTFRMLYAFTENFVLPLSHDEVVHGKGSLLGKMTGDDWQKAANLRLLFGCQWAQPGKKLLFMGCEFAPWREWSHEESLEWHLLQYPLHAGVQRWVRDLNRLYREEPALHSLDCDPRGFEWIDCHDVDQSVLSWIRRDAAGAPPLVIACNFTSVPRYAYRLGVPAPGRWEEVLNGDAPLYGGSGMGNLGGLRTQPIPSHGQGQSLALTLPPLAMVVFRAPQT
jgi:1,4-alpha-glucan branching enzyme